MTLFAVLNKNHNLMVDGHEYSYDFVCKALATAMSTADLAEAVRKLGLEELVRDWHAGGAYDKHPDELRVTLPTDCGTVYAIAAALSALEEKG